MPPKGKQQEAPDFIPAPADSGATPDFIPAEAAPASSSGGDTGPAAPEGFLANVGDYMKSFQPEIREGHVLGDTLKNAAQALPGVQAFRMAANIPADAYRAYHRESNPAQSTLGKVAYSGAAALAPIVGVNPEAVEGAASRGDYGGILGQVAIPGAMALAGAAHATAPEGTMGRIGAATQRVPGLNYLTASQARTAPVFQDISARIGSRPVEITPGLSDAANRVYDLSQRGSSIPKAGTQFFKRVTTPSKLTGEVPPLRFEEARDFQSKTGDPNVMERAGMTKPESGSMKRLQGALGEATRRTADLYGEEPRYSDALAEYGRAAARDKVLGTVGKAAIYGGIGAGSAYGAKKLIVDKLFPF